MSEHHDIFIHPGHPVEQLVADISRSCGAPLHQLSHGVVDYAGSLGYAAIEVELSHEYLNIPGMPFESYDSFFTIRDFDSDLKREEQTARHILGNLASLNKYSLMLVLDLQVLLDTFTPSQR